MTMRYSIWLSTKSSLSVNSPQGIQTVNVSMMEIVLWLKGITLENVIGELVTGECDMIATAYFKYNSLFFLIPSYIQRNHSSTRQDMLEVVHTTPPD